MSPRTPITYAIVLYLPEGETLDDEARLNSLSLARDTLLASGIVTPQDQMISDVERAQQLYRARVENGVLTEIAGVPTVSNATTVVLSRPRYYGERVYWDADYPFGYPGTFDSLHGGFPVPGPGWGHPSYGRGRDRDWRDHDRRDRDRHDHGDRDRPDRDRDRGDRDRDRDRVDRDRDRGDRDRDRGGVVRPGRPTPDLTPPYNRQRPMPNPSPTPRPSPPPRATPPPAPQPPPPTIDRSESNPPTRDDLDRGGPNRTRGSRDKDP